MPAGIGAGAADPAQRAQHGLPGDVTTDHPGFRAPFEQQVQRVAELLAAAGEHGGVGRHDAFERGCHALADGGVLDHPPEVLRERGAWLQLFEQLLRTVADLSDLLPVDLLDDRVARGEVPVEGADRNSGALGDLLDADVRLTGRESVPGDGEQRLPVAAGVGPQRT